MVSALGQHKASQYVLVRVDTDEGMHGAGEATVTPGWSGETMWSSHAMIDQLLGPALIGSNPLDFTGIDHTMDRLTVGNWFTKSAIEMACWDIAGKATGKPVYELLGGAVRSRTIRCRFSMGAYPPLRARERAAELVAKGFTTIKVKVGTGVNDDIARIAAVRSAVGDDIEVVMDANCGFATANDAIVAAEAMSESRVALFEQPTPRDDFQALADVRKAIEMPVMADDICFDLNHAKLCASHKACDVISVYPGKSGGIRKAKQIVDFAASQGIACSIGSNLELDIASAAMCHLVVACENMQVDRFPGDIMGPDYHLHNVARNPLLIDGPTITITDQPGLGIDVDWEQVAELC